MNSLNRLIGYSGTIIAIIYFFGFIVLTSYFGLWSYQSTTLIDQRYLIAGIHFAISLLPAFLLADFVFHLKNGGKFSNPSLDLSVLVLYFLYLFYYSSFVSHLHVNIDKYFLFYLLLTVAAAISSSGEKSFMERISSPSVHWLISFLLLLILSAAVFGHLIYPTIPASIGGGLSPLVDISYKNIQETSRYLLLDENATWITVRSPENEIVRFPVDSIDHITYVHPNAR